jgi:hypothetical protein
MIKIMNMGIPAMSRNQILAVSVLSLMWLWYLVSKVPAYAASQKDPKKLDATKCVLATILGIILAYLIVSVVSKALKKKGDGAPADISDASGAASGLDAGAAAGSSTGAPGGMGGLGFDAGDMSLDSSDMSSYGGGGPVGGPPSGAGGANGNGGAGRLGGANGNGGSRAATGGAPNGF